MSIDINVSSLWGGAQFTFTKPIAEPDDCVYAREFGKWVNGWLFPKLITQTPNMALINQAYLLLQRRYFDWRNAVDKKHRDYANSNHICIYHVYVQAYEKLMALELSMVPPVLFLPRPAKPAPIPGIYLGDREDDVGMDDD